ncbi:NAD(P)-binding protein [Lophiostoma macrostomum CBS 122681]|uniref:NAD(P)-binding protein n=1 Tax=Lophiostoma macrostomum CBS 122681 TaxID=1314788 RepID=A0A6A6TJX6_9PLEO|nr:NAD(P)-binding protein [Lophiostoma macrostomum CBS 122681]
MLYRHYFSPIFPTRISVDVGFASQVISQPLNLTGYNMTITRKICLVTGCSNGGCGAALAEAFRDAGYHVFATARSPSKIPQSLHSSPNVTVLALNVTSSQSIAALAKEVGMQTGGKLDVLVNNAGLGLSKPALDTTIDEARKLFDLNFFGVLEMTQAFAPMLVRAQGCVVNNSSVGGYMAFPFTSIYNASKAALTLAGDAWRLELEPLGVRVITLITGGISTKFLDNLQSQPVDLPETSFYHAIKNDIQAQEETVPFGVPPEKFAQDVLRQVERGATGKFWVGGAACMTRVLGWVMTEWMADRVALWQKPFTRKLAMVRREEESSKKTE